MSVTILQITDTHIYANEQGALYGVNTNQTLKTVVDAIVAEKIQADFAVLTGDLVHDEDEAAYRRLVELLKPLNLPVYAIPGNHDIPEAMRAIFAVEPFLWCDRLLLNDCQFLFVNTLAVGCVGGVISEEHYQQLTTYLEACHLPSIIFMHHPVLPVGSAWLDRIGLQQPQRFLSLLDKYAHIKAIVNGHVHQAFEYVDERGVCFLGTPSTCAQFAPGQDEFSVGNQSPGWRVIKLANNGELTSYIKRV